MDGGITGYHRLRNLCRQISLKNKAKVVPLGPFPKTRQIIYGSSVGTNWGGLNERGNLLEGRCQSYAADSTAPLELRREREMSGANQTFPLKSAAV